MATQVLLEADEFIVQGKEVRLKERRTRIFSPIVIASTALIVVLVLYPIFRLLQRGIFGESEESGVDLIKLVQQAWLPGLMIDTIVVSLGSAVIAVIVATLLAWLNERTDATLGTIGDVLPLVPLFLPAVAMAIGWVMLGAPGTGFVNSVIPGEALDMDIYTYQGLIFVYVLSLVPYAYLPISSAFRAIDLSREEAARVCGAGNIRVFFTVALRSVMPAVTGALAMVAIVSFAMYSVPVVIATRAKIDIMSVRLVRSITDTYPTDYTTAIGLSLFLFVMLIPFWLIQQRVIGGGHFARVGERTEGAARTRLGPWKWVGRAIMICYILFSCVLPVAAMVIVSFQKYWNPDLLNAVWTTEHYQAVLSNRVAQGALQNSFLLGLGCGLLTVIAGLMIIIYKTLYPGKIASAADGIAKITGAFSSTVLGVGFILAFAGPPFKFGSTVWILVISYLIVMLRFSVLQLESARAQISESLTEASEVSGAWDWRTVRSVVLPLMRSGIFSTWALLFVLMTGELALAALLATPRTPVIGLVLLDYWGQGSFTSVAVMSVLMTVMAGSIVTILLLCGKAKWQKKR
jgi:iron(III) transport system permease protein